MLPEGRKSKARSPLRDRLELTPELQPRQISKSNAKGYPINKEQISQQATKGDSADNSHGRGIHWQDEQREKGLSTMYQPKGVQIMITGPMNNTLS